MTALFHKCSDLHGVLKEGKGNACLDRTTALYLFSIQLAISSSLSHGVFGEHLTIHNHESTVTIKCRSQQPTTYLQGIN